MMTKRGTHWTNWAGNQQAWPERIFVPESRADLVEIVRTANEQEKRIRVCGEGHTFSALVPTDDFLVDVRALALKKLQRALASDASRPPERPGKLV